MLNPLQNQLNKNFQQREKELTFLENRILIKNIPNRCSDQEILEVLQNFGPTQSYSIYRIGKNIITNNGDNNGINFNTNIQHKLHKKLDIKNSTVTANIKYTDKKFAKICYSSMNCVWNSTFKATTIAYKLDNQVLNNTTFTIDFVDKILVSGDTYDDVKNHDDKKITKKKRNAEH